MIRTLVISLVAMTSLIAPQGAQAASSTTLSAADHTVLLEQERYRISASQARQIVRNRYPSASRVIVTGLVENTRRPYWGVRVEIDGRQRSVRVDANSGAIF